MIKRDIKGKLGFSPRKFIYLFILCSLGPLFSEVFFPHISFAFFLVLSLPSELKFVGIKTQRCYLQKTVQKEVRVLITKVAAYTTKKTLAM